MVDREPGVVLITGIMAAGKSTVAQRLAERLPRSVHLRGGVFRRMIVNGRVEMGPDGSEAAMAQLRLRYRLAATAAASYRQAGFPGIYQDVIIGPLLGEVVDMLRGLQPLHVVVLCPSAEAVARREAERGKVGYCSWSPADLGGVLRHDTPRTGLWLDTSDLTADETADAILVRLGEAAV